MKNTWKAAILAFIVAIIYIGIEAYVAITSPISTEQVSHYTLNNSISAQGYIIRKETLIEGGGSGTVDYLVKDGEKVKKGSAVATVYSSAADIDTRSAILSLDKQIDALEKLSGSTGTYISDPAIIEEYLRTNILKTSQMVSNNNFGNIQELKNEINILLNKKRLVMGEIENLNDDLSQLKDKRYALQQQLGNRLKDIYTPYSGYFCSNIDGLEKVLAPSVINSLDVTVLSGLVSSPEHTKGIAGKIITDFEWYYAVILDEASVSNFETGKKATVKFSKADESAVPLIVSYISPAHEGKRVVVFSGSIIIPDLNLNREQTSEIVLKSYTGLKVPSGAVRMLDNKTGVYVLSGMQAKFKEVEVLYEKDGITIVKNDCDKKNALLSSDEIIVGAKKLYDGKIVK